MDIKPVDNETLIKYAYLFGAKARANNQQFGAKDRESLAIYHGVSKWSDIPVELRSVLMKSFWEGWKAESEHYK